jgi:hypothetical protein
MCEEKHTHADMSQPDEEKSARDEWTEYWDNAAELLLGANPVTDETIAELAKKQPKAPRKHARRQPSPKPAAGPIRRRVPIEPVEVDTDADTEVDDDDDEDHGIDQLNKTNAIDVYMSRVAASEQRRNKRRALRLENEERLARQERLALKDYVVAEDRERLLEHDTSELEDAAEQGKANRQFGPKVVFIDLEWHTLDKREMADATAASNRSMITAHICQICAISSDYSLRYNQYVSYRKLKEPWRQMVDDWKILDWSPQDDPRITLPFEDCMELFVETFAADTLFLSYGSTDAMTIFKFLYAESDFDPINGVQPLTKDQHERREATRQTMREKNWRWANVMPWIKEHSVHLTTAPENMVIGGSLGTLYDNLFHKALWLSLPTPVQKHPQIVENREASRCLEETILVDYKTALGGNNRKAFGLVPREWLEVRHNQHRNTKAGTLFKNLFPEFWPTKHLQPVFHVAHTDTIMTMNCVAVICMSTDPELKDAFKRLAAEPRRRKRDLIESYCDRNKIKKGSDERKAVVHAWGSVSNHATTNNFYSMVTSVIARTWFFRKFQLSLSEASAKQIWQWHCDGNDYRSKSSSDLAQRAFLLACKGSRIAPKNSGYPDLMDIPDDEYEIVKVRSSQVVKPDNSDQFQLQFQVTWAGVDAAGKRWPDSWEPAIHLEKAYVLIDEYFKTLRAGPPEGHTVKQQIVHHKDQLIAKYKETNGIPEAPKTNATPKNKKTTAKTTGTPKNATSNNTPTPTKHRKIKGVDITTEVEEEERMQREFESAAKSNKYYSLQQRHDEETKLNHTDLVMTQRSGKFTDKVKAIRQFLIGMATAHEDDELLRTLVRKEHRFSEFRQARFSMDPTKSYTGLPWFSLPTSVAEPNTHMLHTMACRNLSDPNDRSKTRNWAELDVMLWDFDLMVKHRMYVNTRFRFCKECKEFTHEAHHISANDYWVGEYDRQAKSKLRAQSKANARPPPPMPARSVSSDSGSANTSSTSSSKYTRPYSISSKLDATNTPRTKIVSYFALMQARVHSRR